MKTALAAVALVAMMSLSTTGARAEGEFADKYDRYQSGGLSCTKINRRGRTRPSRCYADSFPNTEFRNNGNQASLRKLVDLARKFDGLTSAVRRLFK